MKQAYKDAYSRETERLSKFFLEKYLEHIRTAEKSGWPLCADPGTPRWYVKVGNEASLEGGFIALERALRKVIPEVTRDVGIRPNVCHPLTRWNPGTNVGPFVPPIDYSFEPEADWVELISVWKGGVSGNDYRLGMPVDGVLGVKRAVLDCVVPVLKGGHQCPPHIVGVGIGGTKDYPLRLAKEAALLRPIGDRHPDQDIAKMELGLLDTINGLGFGLAGLPGRTGVLDVHVEIAYTHTMGVPVGVTNQCGTVRRATMKIYADNMVEPRPHSTWFTDYLRRHGE